MYDMYSEKEGNGRNTDMGSSDWCSDMDIYEHFNKILECFIVFQILVHSIQGTLSELLLRERC